VLLAAAALAVAASAVAAEPTPGQSGRWGSVDVGVQWYRPNLDAGPFDPALVPPGSTPPYERMFGTGRGFMFTLGVSRALYTRMGSLEVGVRTGYFQDTAKGFVQDPPGSGNYVQTGAESKFRIVPSSASLTYRFDWPVERHRIPLAPYVRATLERYNWWISDGTGDTTEKGATNGWSAAGGIAFLLDIVDPVLAREFDRDSGVNHTYLFFEISKSSIDDFGASDSWDLSDEDYSLAGGLTFVF
jgi:hypothetical protein